MNEREAKSKVLHFKQSKVSGRDSIVSIEKGGNWLRRISAIKPVQFNKNKKLQEKLFCIGFHKTGTTSLTKALKILKYNPIHGDGRKTWPGADEGVTLTRMIDDGNRKLPTLDMFDAFLDNPYFSIWRHLDEKYDGKFILTVREPDKWIESCCNYYKNRRVRHMRHWMFGEYADPSSSVKARQVWIDQYNRHNEDVISHFGNRDDFLILDITKENDWDNLCRFLEKSTPREDFPHLNKTKK